MNAFQYRSQAKFHFQLGQKTDDKMPVVHRNVEGENNGECFKIKGPKTPFLLTHLEKNYVDKVGVTVEVVEPINMLHTFS